MIHIHDNVNHRAGRKPLTCASNPGQLLFRGANELDIELVTADGLARNTAPAIVVLTISREEICGGRIGSALDRLHVLTDSRENVLLYQEALDFVVDGYNSDPRELCQIPAVREHFKRLATCWPHWFWFLSRGTGAIARLLSLLCDVDVIRVPGRRTVGTRFRDASQARRTMLDLFSRGNALFDTYAIPEELVEASSRTFSEDLA